MSSKGGVSAYKPRCCEAQVLRKDSGMCVDSDKCLSDCAFFKCEAGFSSQGLPGRLLSASFIWLFSNGARRY